MTTSKRNYALDFQKFIFSVLIVLFHSTSMATTDSELIFISGRIGVEFFFIVSGCLMCASAAKAESLDSQLPIGVDTFRFIKGKITSLMPNFIIAHIISFVLFHYNQGITSLKTIGINFVSTLPELLLIKNSGIKAIGYNGVTWYLSAMLLGMLLLYPLIRKYKDVFFYVIAPIGFLFLMGFMYQNYGSLCNLESWNGYFFKGTLRAVADMLGGCICYKAALYLKQYEFTSLSKLLFTIVEYACYIISIVFVFKHKPSAADYAIFGLFMIGVIITYAQVSFDNKIFSHKIFGWFGVYSLSLYLGHSYWRKYNSRIFSESWTFNDKLIAYLILSAVTGLFIMYASIGLRKLWKKYGPVIKSYFIESKKV